MKCYDLQGVNKEGQRGSLVTSEVLSICFQHAGSDSTRPALDTLEDESAPSGASSKGGKLQNGRSNTVCITEDYMTQQMWNV